MSGTAVLEPSTVHLLGIVGLAVEGARNHTRLIETK